MPKNRRKHSERGKKYLCTSTLGGDELRRSALIRLRPLKFKSNTFSLPPLIKFGVNVGSNEPLSEQVDKIEGLHIDSPSESSELPPLHNLLSGVENASGEEIDAMLFPCPLLVELTLRNNSWAGLVNFAHWFCPSAIEWDLKWGERPASEFGVCCAKGDLTSTLPPSELQSLSWCGTYISTQDNKTKCNDNTIGRENFYCRNSY